MIRIVKILIVAFLLLGGNSYGSTLEWVKLSCVDRVVMRGQNYNGWNDLLWVGIIMMSGLGCNWHLGCWITFSIGLKFSVSGLYGKINISGLLWTKFSQVVLIFNIIHCELAWLKLSLWYKLAKIIMGGQNVQWHRWWWVWNRS